MRALVLGGTGFLGGAIASALAAAGHEVVCLSRSGGAAAGEALEGDVLAPDLGLAGEALERVRAETTTIVSCFGSVDWSAGPRVAQLHEIGTANALDLAASCERLDRFVHVSSVLALGRAEGPVGNEELDLGQDFRNWYEHAKHAAELRVRADERVPWRVVRFGPVLGVSGDGPPSAGAGLLAVLPLLLRGYPVHLADHGSYPCYPTDVGAAAEVVVRAAGDAGDRRVWTYYDHRDPTLAETFAALCDAWSVVPRIVAARPWRLASRMMIGPLGVPQALVGYDEPWFELDGAVLDELPGDLPRCPDGYMEATGAALRAHPGRLLAS